MKILSNKTNAKVEYYTTVNIFPILEYDELKENKSEFAYPSTSLYVESMPK